MGIAIVASIGLMFMPPQWFERMQTIQTYEEDQSALGRLNAWGFAINLANARPLVGGGFQTFTSELFVQYAPDPYDFHDSHSIYFEVLGEQGYVGFLLYMTLAILTWRCSSRVLRRTRARPDLYWARSLAAMLQVSLVGYAVGGAFLGLAYFDLLYHLVALSIANRVLVERRLDEGATVEAESLLAALKPRWQPTSMPSPESPGHANAGNAAQDGGSR
jgi:probable O-glycosylation ligase (exosortase A-associated)